MLIRYPWPGNVRELQNTIERIAVVCKRNIVQADVVMQMMREDEGTQPFHVHDWTTAEPIRQALADSRGRKSEAAEKLGISRSTLWRRMKSLGLLPPR